MMHYYSEKEIRDIITSVLEEKGVVAKGGSTAHPVPVKQAQPAAACAPAARKCQESHAPGGVVPVEVSARHVHLTQEAVECLYGEGHHLTKKRDLSQPGEFLSEERVKIVTAKGEFSNVAVLGPTRSAVQVELSLTDSKSLGIKAPVNLSGDLSGAANVLLIGPKGIYRADQSAIVAKTHIHMTPRDAESFGVKDGQKVRVQLQSDRPATLDDVIIRVKDSFSLAMHIDFDEANAAGVTGDTTGKIC